MVLSDSFKQAMRRLAATVTVISTGDGSNRVGMTATAVTSVSSDPATLLVCVNQSAAMHAHLGVGGKMCVNLLRHVHADVSRAFAGQRDAIERFSVGDWASDADGIPYLKDAQANLFCEVKLAVPYATHTIFIGEIIHIQLHDMVKPLIYQDGDYVAAMPLVADIG
jgi:flavin reductase (DIM6/NTAB) family NADH-FMN oxidoreductase RutF